MRPSPCKWPIKTLTKHCKAYSAWVLRRIRLPGTWERGHVACFWLGMVEQGVAGKAERVTEVIHIGHATPSKRCWPCDRPYLCHSPF